jgi:hypothetical protein
MATLNNERQSVRFRLSVVDRERLPGVTGDAPSAAAEGLVLGDLALEHFDRRDKAFWPFLHLAVFRMTSGDAETLVASLERLLRGEAKGFAFRSSVSEDLGLQLGQALENRYQVEVGVDLKAFLAETAGALGAAGESLALFRFSTNQAELVCFARELKSELAAVGASSGGAEASASMLGE